MKSVNWTDYLEKLGLLALIASIIFVGLQLRQDRHLASAQVIAESDARVSELATLVSENRDVWLKGMKGEDLSEVEDMVFRAVAEAVYRRHLGMYYRMRLLGTAEPDDMVRRYAFRLYQYPNLRRVFSDQARIGDASRRYFNTAEPDGFDEKVSEILTELDKAVPDLPDRTFIPF